MIAILESICSDDHDQKLINCLSRGGLTTVHNGCLLIFLMTRIISKGHHGKSSQN